MNPTRATLPRTAGVPACEFWRRLAASPHCRGEDTPQLAGEDGCGTGASPWRGRAGFTPLHRPKVAPCAHPHDASHAEAA